MNPTPSKRTAGKDRTRRPFPVSWAPMPGAKRQETLEESPQSARAQYPEPDPEVPVPVPASDPATYADLREQSERAALGALAYATAMKAHATGASPMIADIQPPDTSPAQPDLTVDFTDVPDADVVTDPTVVDDATAPDDPEATPESEDDETEEPAPTA